MNLPRVTALHALSMAVAALTLAALTLTARPALAGEHTMNISTLTEKQRGIVPIAAFTATGDMPRLDAALREGLEAGLTVSEIKEVLVQLYAYAGFPRSLNGLSTFMAVLKDRAQKGIADEPGEEAGPLPAGKSRLELGTEVQTRLVGVPVKGPLFDFAPAIDQFLKEHLFADIFGRDALDWQSREIATISALASLDGTGSQLRSHCRVGLNVGLSEVQLKTLAEVLAAKVGKKEAGNAATALGEVLGSR
ncbi:carboxymuconolactone decarboxylase family protein [Humidesulfovibrio idahonensis]